MRVLEILMIQWLSIGEQVMPGVPPFRIPSSKQQTSQILIHKILLFEQFWTVN